MKNILLISVLLFAFSSDLSAQTFDETGFEKFCKEIKSVSGSFEMREREKKHEKIYEMSILSKDEDGYKNICSVMDRHDLYFAEEFLGLSLFVGVREGGGRRFLFYNDGVALAIMDVPYKPMIEIYFRRGVDVMDLMNVKELFNHGFGIGNVLFGNSNVEKTELGNLSLVISEDDNLTVIGDVVNSKVEECLSGWIMEMGLPEAGSCGRKSPLQVATEYAMKYNKSMTSEDCLPMEDVALEDVISAGEPLYLYQVSDNDARYTSMVNDFSEVFALKDGDKYKGMKVVYRTEVNGNRFVHLYSSAGTVLVYDSPADKLCRMDIVLGGIDAFKKAVDSIVVDGEVCITRKCNIVINCDSI